MAEADDVKYDGSGIIPPHIKDKIEDAPELEPNEDRFRITVRGDNTELRGYIDVNEIKTLNDLAAAMKPFGVVVASYAGPDYDPFGIDQPEHPPTLEKSVAFVKDAFENQSEEDALEFFASIHFGQALVIRNERHQKEWALAELQRRELHHFETEQIIEKVRGVINAEIGWESPAVLIDRIRWALGEVQEHGE